MMDTGSFGPPPIRDTEGVVGDDVLMDEIPVERESGIHPTFRCLMQGAELEDALLHFSRRAKHDSRSDAGEAPSVSEEGARSSPPHKG